ncbi:MAG: glucose 1-dehydrogenase [Roseburia sp.]|nr:glucose 1-dehydrogenase [Roseburia sp.]
MEKILQGKNVILTGANRGIGNAILKGIAEAGANCWCMVRTVDSQFEEELRACEQQNDVWLKAVNADLSDSDSIKGAMKEITAEKINIDILINNAGAFSQNAFLQTSLEEIKRLMQVNYYAPIQLIQAVSKRMIRQKSGIIINVGSVSGIEHTPGTVAYGGSKAALLWMTRTISRELAPYGIRVNGIAPGSTKTDMTAQIQNTIDAKVLERMNLKRQAEPEEIAKAVLFLASEQASFISGEILKVDGGRF